MFEHYAVYEDGRPVTQSTAPWAIHLYLQAADIRPGQYVLEIGTGSGYSTAMLAGIVGRAGRVLSVEVNAELAERARRLLRADRLDQAEVYCSDARMCLPSRGPFDRLIAWATSASISGYWLEMVQQDGLLVLPVSFAPMLGATAVARVRKTEGAPRVERLMSGAFVPLHGPTSTGLPDLDALADIAWSEGDEAEWQSMCWVSATWLRAASTEAKSAIRHCVNKLARADAVLAASESPYAFATFLSVERPDAIVIQLPTIGRAVGIGSECGIAVQALGQHVLLTSNDCVARRLEEAAQVWRLAGRPDLPDYRPQLFAFGNDWVVRLGVGTRQNGEG